MLAHKFTFKSRAHYDEKPLRMLELDLYAKDINEGEENLQQKIFATLFHSSMSQRKI